MTAITRTIALSLFAASLALTGALPAHAKAKSKSKAQAHGVKLQRAPAFTYANGQTAAERERAEENRLRRECRGRPNAGACMGYTR